MARSAQCRAGQYPSPLLPALLPFVGGLVDRLHATDPPSLTPSTSAIPHQCDEERRDRDDQCEQPDDRGDREAPHLRPPRPMRSVVRLALVDLALDGVKD